jgi:hypothetical protein
MASLKPGDRVRLEATDRHGVVVSFPGRPLDVLMDDEEAGPRRTGYDAAALLARHCVLFRQAALGKFDARKFAGPGGRLYSVGDTLRCVERELHGRGQVMAHEQAIIDLTNILVQWEEDPVETG